MRVALVSDTHAPRRGPLPAACLERLRAADLIVHAGDHSDRASLELIRGLGAPVVAVRGNVEDAGLRAALPETAEVRAGDLVIGVVHDAGPEPGRVARLRHRFPGADVVVFGHSHIPLHRVGPGGFAIVNPGSPTDRRRQPRCTMAEIAVRAGAPPEVTFWAVDDPPGPLDPGLVRR